LADSMVELFWDENAGAFYDTGTDHESLVVRPRDVFDNAQPCGGSVASDLLLRLALITGNQEYTVKATTPLRALHDLMGKAPAGTGHWLAALDFHISSPKELAVIGPRENLATRQLLDTINGRYLPNKVVVGAEGLLDESTQIPLLQDRGMVDGKPAAYVCQNYLCKLPVTEPEDLAQQLAS